MQKPRIKSLLAHGRSEKCLKNESTSGDNQKSESAESSFDRWMSLFYGQVIRYFHGGNNVYMLSVGIHSLSYFMGPAC